jgi:DNA-binding NarL/FixJ family response regulator
MDGFNVADRVLKVIPEPAHPHALLALRRLHAVPGGEVGRARVHRQEFEHGRDPARRAEGDLGGRIYFSQAFQAARVARRSDPRSFIKVLSDWERAILSLIGQGLSDEEIGERLNLSPRTVQTHRSNILRKLNLKGTPKLIAFASRTASRRCNRSSGSIPVYT